MSSGRIIGFSIGVAAVLGMTALSAPVTAAEMADVRLLATGCYNCHGPNGKSVGKEIDAINDLNEAKMKKKMDKFRAGGGDQTIMDRIVKGYTDEEIDAIAKYIAEANK